MKAKIVCYRFPEISPSKRTMFHKEMYGYKDFSNKGNYVYQRKGAIDKIKHRKIIDAVIVTNNKGAEVISKILEKYNAEIHIFDVTIPFKL